MLSAKSEGFAGMYQRCKPTTDKNIGRNLLKQGNPNQKPHYGAKELARGLKQAAKLAARA